MAKIYKYLDVNVLSGGSSGGGSPVTKYIQTFNDSVDWGAPSGGTYLISIPESTHGLGTDPVVKVYESVGGSFDEVTLHTLNVNASGDITLRGTENTDTRCAGKVVIV